MRMEYSLGLYEKAIPSGLSFEEMFRITAGGGFDRLEISIDESEQRQHRLDWSYAEQRALGNMARECDIPIHTMCLSGHRKYPFGAHAAEDRRRAVEMMKKAIHFSVNTGVRIIQLAGYDVYYEEGDADTRRWFLENLREAVEYAARWGIILAFETMETPFMDTVEKAMVYVREVNSPWLGIYPDIGNLKNAAMLYHQDVTEDLRKGAGHIVAVHLKETRPGVYRDMNFGDGGHTEYLSCIEAALQMGVRIFTGEFWHQTGQDYKTTISDANLFLRDKIETAMRNVI